MKKELIAHRTPKSPIAEAFRTLRTNIQFMNSKKQLKTLLVTSTMPGEGKSWTTANLAITFAQAGKKVIIIDADMRKGRQHTLFNLDNRPGLSNYLSGIDETGIIESLDIFKYIKATEIQNLYLMPCGNYPPNPSELLASEATNNMIERLQNTFDMIIFDGAPSLLVTDALILSRIVDSTIIVTKYNDSKKEDLLKVKRNIENVGGHIAGVILNRVPINAKKLNETYYYSSTAMVSSGSKKSKNASMNHYRDFSMNVNTPEYIIENDKKISKERAQEIIDDLNKYLKK